MEGSSFVFTLTCVSCAQRSNGQDSNCLPDIGYLKGLYCFSLNVCKTVLVTNMVIRAYIIDLQ
jgi:hypothetical protein